MSSRLGPQLVDAVIESCLGPEGSDLTSGFVIRQWHRVVMGTFGGQS